MATAPNEVKLLPCEELLRAWQTERSEWHGPVTLEVVREYAEWREARPTIVTDEVVERLQSALETIKDLTRELGTSMNTVALVEVHDEIAYVARAALATMPAIVGGEA